MDNDHNAGPLLAPGSSEDTQDDCADPHLIEVAVVVGQEGPNSLNKLAKELADLSRAGRRIRMFPAGPFH